MSNTYVQKVIDNVDVSEVVKKYDSITELDKWGRFALQSGLIPQGTSLSQAMALIQCGKEIGLQPLQSLRSMSFIKGRLTMSVQLQLALAKQRGVKIVDMKEEESSCEITLERSGEKITCSYTLEDAKKAGLVKQDGNYEKYLKQMLRWRATGDCLRMIAPDLVMGLLSPEEAESIEIFNPAPKVNEAGIVDPTKKQAPEPPGAYALQRADPATTPDKTKNEPDDLISEAQGKRFYAIAKGAGWDDASLKGWLMDNYKIDSTKKISRTIYEHICEKVKNMRRI